MIEHLTIYLTNFITQPVNIILTISFLTLAAISFHKARQTKYTTGTRLFLLYAHIALIIAPFALLSYTVGCQIPAYDCSAKSLIYSIPILIGGITAIASILGFAIGPKLYARALGAKNWDGTPEIQKTLNKHASTRIKIYTLNTAKPTAFSYGNHIFISIGMIDILTPKELEAVILHELGHIKHRSSWLKAGRIVAKAANPLAHFSNWTQALQQEEKIADEYAIKTQKTHKYIENARNKVDDYNNF